MMHAQAKRTASRYLLACTLLCAVSLPALADAEKQSLSLKLVHSFSGPDGLNPSSEATLRKGPAGSLYGVIQQGGSSGNGVLYRIGSGDRFSLLHSFSGDADGAQPTAVVLGDNGVLYGTTAFGGANSYGTAFRVTPSGGIATIHDFDGSDANHPSGTLVALNGQMYGASGGSGTTGRGTVYRLSPAGNVFVTFDFSDSVDEAPDYFGLSASRRGVLYGTTSAGFPADAHGTVFRVIPSGAFATLHTLTDTPDGNLPTNAPVEGADGNLYGTTLFGGANGCGTIYRVTPAGSYSVVYSFMGAGAGCAPFAALTVGQNGRLYGTTSAGGALDRGTIFEFRPSGTLRTLYSFGPTEDGCCGLVEASPGQFYGLTAGGGEFGLGSIYKFKTN